MKSLLTEKVAKDKLTEVQNKYCRPENCTNLVVPKINKQIWQQLRQETRNNDSAIQHNLCFCQDYMLSSKCAIVQVGIRGMF